MSDVHGSGPFYGSYDGWKLARPDDGMYGDEIWFENWMEQVEDVFRKKLALSTKDLPDWTWYDEFDSGSSPEEAYENWEAENGEELGLF